MRRISTSIFCVVLNSWVVPVIDVHCSVVDLERLLAFVEIVSYKLTDKGSMDGSETVRESAGKNDRYKIMSPQNANKVQTPRQLLVLIRNNPPPIVVFLPFQQVTWTVSNFRL